VIKICSQKKLTISKAISRVCSAWNERFDNPRTEIASSKKGVDFARPPARSAPETEAPP